MVEKSTALEILKEKLGKNPTISERTINEIVDHNLSVFSTMDISTEQFVEFTFPVLKTANQNLNHDVALKLKSLERPVEPTPVVEPKAGLTIEDVQKVLSSTLEDPLKQVRSELETLKSEQMIKTNLTMGIEKFKTFNPDESRKAVVDLAVSDILPSLTKDDTPDVIAEKIKGKYNALTSAFGVSGYKSSPATPEDTQKAREQVIAEIRERNKNK